MDILTLALAKKYTQNAVGGLWDKWNTTTTYATGQIVLYNGIPYQKKSGASTQGTFVPAEWEQINISDELEKIALKQDKADAVSIVKLTDGTETLAQLSSRLAQINLEGKHVFFDTSSLNADMYLCTIFIDGTTKYRMTDAVTGKTSIGSYEASKTLSTILSEAIADLVTITVTCTTQDGVTVTGQTVTLRNGTSATAPVIATKSYNGQPVSFVVAKDTAYFVSVSNTLAGHFNPTTASGSATTDTSVILTYSDTAHLTTFADIKGALDGGATANDLVGVEIADTWIATNGTSYSDPMICVSVETVQDADGVEHTGAIMQRKYASLDAIQFDAIEGELATGTYEDELTYFTKSGNTITLLVKGTDYNVGDTITGTVYKDSIYDSSKNMYLYGYNRYRDSAYRQYLNSNATTGNWWTSTHIGDIAPNELNSVRGYKAGCSASLLQYAKPIKQTCYTNSVTDGSVVDVVCDQFFLPSGTQMYGSVNANEGTYWKYWKDATGLASPSNDANEGRIMYAIENHTSASVCRLRSAGRSHSYGAWYVLAAGGLDSGGSGYGAYYSYRCVPACAIY